MNHQNPDRSSTRLRRRATAVLAAGVIVLSAAAATASAKEIGSGGGGGGGTATCNPVSSLTVKADPRVGELGFANIAVSYSVKPCVNGQIVTVANTVSEYAAPSVVVYSDPAAPLNGKFAVNGVRVRTTYKVTIDVLDAIHRPARRHAVGIHRRHPEGRLTRVRERIGRRRSIRSRTVGPWSSGRRPPQTSTASPSLGCRTVRRTTTPGRTPTTATS